MRTHTRTHTETRTHTHTHKHTGRSQPNRQTNSVYVKSSLEVVNKIHVTPRERDGKHVDLTIKVFRSTKKGICVELKCKSLASQ